MEKTKRAYTFKGTAAMHGAMQGIMDHWGIDRTSVIKLALYLLATYTGKPDVRKMSIFELVEDIEKHAPEDFPRYERFGS